MYWNLQEMLKNLTYMHHKTLKPIPASQSIKHFCFMILFRSNTQESCEGRSGCFLLNQSHDKAAVFLLNPIPKTKCSKKGLSKNFGKHF